MKHLWRGQSSPQGMIAVRENNRRALLYEDDDIMGNLSFRMWISFCEISYSDIN
jgi:hypothetical protein